MRRSRSNERRLLADDGATSGAVENGVAFAEYPECRNASVTAISLPVMRGIPIRRTVRGPDVDAIRAEIEPYEAALRAAILANDVDALDALLDDDLIFTIPSGQVISKHDDLSAHRDTLARKAVPFGSGIPPAAPMQKPPPFGRGFLA